MGFQVSLVDAPSRTSKCDLVPSNFRCRWIFLCGAKRASGRAKANLGAANWRVKFVLQARTLDEL